MVKLDEQDIAYYAARAKGGIGLDHTGAIMGTRLAWRVCLGQESASVFIRDICMDWAT